MKLCKKVCNACPFRYKSAPGWLGPHTVDDILYHYQVEIPFSCHKQRKDDSHISDMHDGTLEICRGWVASASKSYKLFGQNIIYGQVLKELQKEITQDDMNLVMSKREFQKHHNI